MYVEESLPYGADHHETQLQVDPSEWVNTASMQSMLAAEDQAKNKSNSTVLASLPVGSTHGELSEMPASVPIESDGWLEAQDAKHLPGIYIVHLPG